VNGDAVFHRREADETVAIGQLDRKFAQIRISDTVRYESAFELPEALPDPDSHTLVQFPVA